MRSVERGEIYWIEPSVWKDTGEHGIKKRRPAIIVSSDTINHRDWTYEVVYLTTQPKRDEVTHVAVRSGITMSTALCEQISTISSEQIGDYVGTCTEAELASIDAALMISLGLDVPDPDTIEYEEDRDEAEKELWGANQDLQEELIRAKSEVDTMRRLYNELLQRLLGK